MKNEKYVRFGNGKREYHNLVTDPYGIWSNPGSADSGTRTYWEERMDDLRACNGAECQTAENAPELPVQFPAAIPPSPK